MWIKCLAEGQKVPGIDRNRTRNPLIQSQGSNPIQYATAPPPIIISCENYSLFFVKCSYFRFVFVLFIEINFNLSGLDLYLDKLSWVSYAQTYRSTTRSVVVEDRYLC